MKLLNSLRSLLIIEDTPHRVALSFAVGTFVGFSPFLGFHIILVLLISWPLKLNRIASITGVFITNPWTFIPIYTFCAWLGAIILGIDHIIPERENLTWAVFVEHIPNLLLPLLLGCFIMGAVAAPISYFLVKRAVIEHNEQLQKLENE